METAAVNDKLRKLGTTAYYMALAIELAIVLIDKSAFTNPIEGRLFQVTFVLLVLKIMMTQYTTKEWITMIGFAILGAISYFATERNDIIRIVVFVAATKGISLRNMLKIVFYTILSGTVLLMVLSLMGVLGEVSVTAPYRGDLVETRYTLGLGHPNALHCMIWSLVILGIYLYFDQLKWYAYLLLFLGNIGLFLLTDSKTGVIITTLTILAAACLYAFPKLQRFKWIYLLGALAVLGCFFISLVASKYGYRPGPLMGIDQYVTGRIRWSYYYGGIPFWSLFSVPDNNIYFDMGLMRLFYWYGIVPGVTYLVVHLLMIRDCSREKDSMALLVIVMFSIYTVFEAHAVSVYILRNYVILLLAGSWSRVFMVTGGRTYYVWRVFATGENHLESN
ncbi:MAG: hypothetical protein RR238_03815 [Lachnospiraceae bacterium]